MQGIRCSQNPYKGWRNGSIRTTEFQSLLLELQSRIRQLTLMRLISLWNLSPAILPPCCLQVPMRWWPSIRTLSLAATTASCLHSRAHLYKQCQEESICLMTRGQISGILLASRILEANRCGFKLSSPSQIIRRGWQLYPAEPLSGLASPHPYMSFDMK